MVRTREQWQDAWGADFTNFILTLNTKPCWMCGKPTAWLELSFEAPLHPGECDDRAWREFVIASKASDAKAMTVATS